MGLVDAIIGSGPTWPRQPAGHWVPATSTSIDFKTTRPVRGWAVDSRGSTCVCLRLYRRPVQFGLDAEVQYAYRLDGVLQGAMTPSFPTAECQSRLMNMAVAGATLKMRYSKTELKVGELRPLLPVVIIDDSRQLVTTYRGGLLESKEIDGLTLIAGGYWIGARNSSSYEKLYLQTGSVCAMAVTGSPDLYGAVAMLSLRR